MNFEISNVPINIQQVIDKVVQHEAGAINGSVRKWIKGETLTQYYKSGDANANQNGKAVKKTYLSKYDANNDHHYLNHRRAFV